MKKIFIYCAVLLLVSVNTVGASSLPTIDSLSLLSSPRIDSTNQILYASTPDSHITTQYVSCATSTAVNTCTFDDRVVDQGEVPGDGNPTIDITIPNDESLIGQYLTYCIRITEVAFDGSKSASPLTCRSEMIDVGLGASASDSYLSQSHNFSLYEQPDFINNKQIVTSNSALLALLRDGSPLIYGNDLEVSDAPSFSGPIASLYSMLDSLVVLQEDHQLLTWGRYVRSTPAVVSNVEAIYPALYAISLVTLDGSISTLGDNAKGAQISARAQSQIQSLLSLGGKVRAIYHTAEAFLGVFDMPEGNQRLVAWGNPVFGGMLPDGVFTMTFDVKNIVTSQNAFAIVERDGNVFTWNGNSKLVSYHNVQSVKASRYAFAAITHDGDVFAWGENGYGGQLSTQAKRFTDEKKITRLCATDGAFLALADGEKGVAAWGNSELGGYIPKTTQSTLDDLNISHLVSCSSTEGAFALYYKSGVWVWGASKSGGLFPPELPTSGIEVIITNNHAFLMKAESGVYSWGDEASGGCIPDGRNCLSLENASLNLRAEIANMDMETLEMGSFHQFSEEERSVDSGFYIKDEDRLLVWGKAVPDGSILL